MNIQKISAPEGSIQTPAFKASYVTLSKKNLGEPIAKNVVDTFSKSILPEIKKTVADEAVEIINAAGGPGRVIANAEDFKNNVNFFALAAGSGSRFKALAQTVGDYNKISLPFKIGENENVHMLDFAMAMGKYFIGDEGVNKIVAAAPSGSFGDIVAHYLAGNPIKDTVVCCGDNVFGVSSKELMTFFTKMINDPNKHVALIGAKRAPEIVVDRFGLLGVEGSLKDDSLKLTSFVEKPKAADGGLELARKTAVEGECIANTGMFYISKEGMTNLINEIKSGVNNIKKNETELYDFANAVTYVHSMLPEWFGIPSKEGANVKVVEKWEDVGEPAALYQFANDVKNGQYLHNFPKAIAQKIKDSFGERVQLEAKTPYIAFTDSAKVTESQIANAKNVEGVNIIV